MPTEFSNQLDEAYGYKKVDVNDLRSELAKAQQELAEAVEVMQAVVKARESVCLLGPMAFTSAYLQAQAFLAKHKEIRNQT